MSESSQDRCNPIQYYHRGLPIRKYNSIHLRIDEITYKELIDAEHDTGLSLRKILSHSSTPCERCINTYVIVLTDNGAVKIKRGIFSKRLPTSDGNRSHVISRKVINQTTGEIYKSVREASDLLGIKYTTLLDKLNNKTENNTNCIFHEQST